MELDRPSAGRVFSQSPAGVPRRRSLPDLERQFTLIGYWTARRVALTVLIMIFFRGLLTAVLTTALSAQCFGQAPAPAPVADPAIPLDPNAIQFLPFKNASFEEPAVEKRTTDIEGGNPAAIEASDWGHFFRRKGQGEGALNVGLTNEIARTGKQSIFLDFAGITGKRFTASIMTQLLPVKPQQPYKAGMWGRMDRERPLTLDQRRPYLRMEFEFYKADEETQVGETEYRVMQIPGSLKKLLFTSSRWSEAYGIVRAPAEAALMKVSYVFNVRNDPGKTDGIIYFDDAFVQELPADFPIEASDAPESEETDEDPAAEAATEEDAPKPATPEAPVPLR